MLKQKYLIEKNNEIKKAYLKRDEITKNKEKLVDINKEDFVRYSIKCIFIIILFTILTQLKLWSFIPFTNNDILPQFLLHCSLASTPILLLYFFEHFYTSDNESMKTIEAFFYLIVYIVVSTLFYAIAAGSVSVLYCIINNIPKSPMFLEIATDHHLYLTFIGVFFFLFRFVRYNKTLLNKKDLINKKEKLNKELEINDSLIKKTKSEISLYLKQNLISTKDADHLLFIKDDNLLTYLRTEISTAIRNHANNQGFASYRELKRKEFSSQEEMIYNY
jgi:hypothetical protein